MANIVQLKENGVVKCMKIHADTIDGMEGKLVKVAGNETVLGTENFQDGTQVGGKSVPVNIKPIYEVVKGYWDGIGAYLAESQSVTISNDSNADEIVSIFSHHNDDDGGIAHSIPATPNTTRLKYELPAVIWVGSASTNPATAYKKISISKSGTFLVITGGIANTLDETNKKIVLRGIGVTRHK